MGLANDIIKKIREIDEERGECRGVTNAELSDRMGGNENKFAKMTKYLLGKKRLERDDSVKPYRYFLPGTMPAKRRQPSLEGGDKIFTLWEVAQDLADKKESANAFKKTRERGKLNFLTASKSLIRALKIGDLDQVTPQRVDKTAVELMLQRRLNEVDPPKPQTLVGYVHSLIELLDHAKTLKIIRSHDLKIKDVPKWVEGIADYIKSIRPLVDELEPSAVKPPVVDPSPAAEAQAAVNVLRAAVNKIRHADVRIMALKDLEGVRQAIAIYGIVSRD